MNNLSFLGSRVSHQLTPIPTPIRHTYETKYRGQHVTLRQAIIPSSTCKGLTYRGVAY